MDDAEELQMLREMIVAADSFEHLQEMVTRRLFPGLAAAVDEAKASPPRQHLDQEKT